MRQFLQKFRILALLGVVLVVGFLTTSIASYKVARDTISHDVSGRSLPLNSDRIHAEIQKELLRPVFVAALMANDAFLRDWIQGGERDSAQVARYLKDMQQKYAVTGSFLVSDRTRRFYDGEGAAKPLQPGDPRDIWFSRARSRKLAYESEVDQDRTTRDAITLSINHRLLDEQGNFIGATGVSLTLNSVSELIRKYQSQFRCRIFFVDDTGIIALGSHAMQHLRDQPGMRQAAADILRSAAKPMQTGYQANGVSTFVNSRFIPELGWHLVIAQSDRDDIRPVQSIFLFSVIVGALVTGLVLVMVMTLIARYQAQLDNIATVDSLTGLINRPAFEFVFQQTLLETNRNRLPLSLVLFRIDMFKRVNETLGEQIGDDVLRQVAQLARKAVRDSDAVCRWGGDQFLIQLRDCPLDKAIGVAERLRLSVVSHDFDLDDPGVIITVSLGIAQYQCPQPGEDFLERVEEALATATEKGRNRTEPQLADVVPPAPKEDEPPAPTVADLEPPAPRAETAEAQAV